MPVIGVLYISQSKYEASLSRSLCDFGVLIEFLILEFVGALLYITVCCHDISAYLSSVAAVLCKHKAIICPRSIV